MALTLDATSAGRRPILIKRSRATSLPALASLWYQAELREKPGCDGVAARLPKDPGVQKLSPLSSAQAGGAAKASAAAMAPPARRCGHARCRAPDALIPIPPFPRCAHVLIGKPVPTFGTCANARATTAAAAVSPADYTESVASKRGRRARSWARHEECRRLLLVRNSARRRGERRSARTRCADHLAGALAPLAAERPRLGGTGRDDGARVGLGGTGIGLGGTDVGLDHSKGEPIALRGGRDDIRRHLGSDIPPHLGGGIGLAVGGDIRRHLRDRIRTDVGPATRERRNDGRTQRQGREGRRNFVPRHLMTPTQPPPWRLRARLGLRGISRRQGAKGSPGQATSPALEKLAIPGR